MRPFKSYNFTFLLTILAVYTFISACSTKKKSWVNRTYHNTTARYNGYYWAGEAIKEGEITLADAHKDNFKEILPIYALGDENTSKACYPEMDRAYTKCGKVVKRHSMLIKGKEYCKWIDENYLNIGITHYYKQDYFAAQEVFDYITRQYKTQETKYDAQIWSARTQIEMGRYVAAKNLLDVLENDKKFPDRLIGAKAKALAQLHIKRSEYPEALEQVELALKHEKKRRIKTRLHFILAQLYAKKGNNKLAFEHYKIAGKKAHYYDMQFYSKLFRALNADGSKKSTKEQLFKMSKEEKNKDYLDQIYYTLAQIEKREGNQGKQIEYLKKSVAASTTNNYQKAESYLELADIYFKQPKYDLSEANYDSATAILPENYPNYDLILERKEALSELIAQLKIIHKEDSLQRIYKLPESEQRKLIAKLIEDAEKEEERKAELEELRKVQELNKVLDDNSALTTGLSGAGKWYFYNPQTISQGTKEFKRIWGSRPLEDNWRRKNKSSNSFEEELPDTAKTGTDSTKVAEEITPEEKEKIEKLSDPKNEEYYKKDLFKSDADLIASHERIKEAYYKAGTIYKEKLKDPINSSESFKTLVEKYDSSDYHLPSYFQLYLLNMDMKKEIVALKYKNLIISRYPNSEYAQILLDPDYLKKKMESAESVDNYYLKTYEMFQAQQYNEVLNRCMSSITMYPANIYSARFSLLRALSLGAKEGQGSLVTALKDITQAYPGDPVKTKAEEMLTILTGTSIEKAKVDSSLFQFKPDESHKLILLADSKGLNVNDLKIAVSDFNTTFFGLENYTTSNVIFDKDKMLIVVSGLQNFDKAQRYISAIKGDATINSKAGTGSSFLLISDSNYQPFYQTKNISEYKEFYKKFYEM